MGLLAIFPFAMLAEGAAKKKPRRKRKLNRNYAAADLSYGERVDRQYIRLLDLGYAGKLPLMSMISTVEPYEDLISGICKNLNMPPEFGIGMNVLENGGGTNRRSPCCVGMMQISYFVGEKYGLIRKETVKVKGEKVQRTVDQRTNPKANIKAGFAYLDELYREHFPDWELAVQAYHTGWGRLSKAISAYITSTFQKTVKWDEVCPDTIKDYKITWLKMIQNSKALDCLLWAPDETETYLPRVIACSRIYQEREAIKARFEAERVVYRPKMSRK
jgi:hypothetical protein